jgi:hypothetical protein
MKLLLRCVVFFASALPAHAYLDQVTLLPRNVFGQA